LCAQGEINDHKAHQKMANNQPPQNNSLTNVYHPPTSHKITYVTAMSEPNGKLLLLCFTDRGACWSLFQNCMKTSCNRTMVNLCQSKVQGSAFPWKQSVNQRLDNRVFKNLILRRHVPLPQAPVFATGQEIHALCC